MITNEEIYNEFQRMKDTLDRWRVKVEAKQEKHDNFLYGNGDVGIDERVRNAERDLAEIKQLEDGVNYVERAWCRPIENGATYNLYTN